MIVSFRVKRENTAGFIKLRKIGSTARWRAIDRTDRIFT